MAPEKNTKPTTSKSTIALGIELWRGWDILGLVLSLAILIVIIVILSVREGKEQPNWKYMSLNTLLSWLSTACKAFILFPASATLSQLKWIWFAERKRPLSDLRVFDSASRGVYGSAELLWKLRLRHFAVLGALATILSVGFEPFVQNLVHYSARLVEDGSRPADLAYSSSYNSLGPMATTVAETYFVDNTLKANVYNSIFNADPTQSWAIPHYTCTTGNCTWGPVPSIAMRALCSDVTHFIDEKCIRSDKNKFEFNCTVSLPNGIEAYHSNNGVRAESNALAVGVPNTPTVYTNQTFLVLQRLEAAVANTVAGGNVYGAILKNGTYVATECALEPIVRSVSTFVDHSQYGEHTLAEWDSVNKYNDIGEVSNQTFGYVLAPDWNEDLGMHPGQNFTISPNARDSINDFITGLFSGFAYTADLTYSYSRTTSNDRYATADAVDTILYGNISGCNDLRTERFRCAMNNIASAMSKSFRDQAYVRDKTTTDMAKGITKVNAIIVDIRWQWLTLPLLFWLLTAVSWAGAAWKTRRASIPKWSDNPLPLLFLYRHYGEDARIEEMEGGLSSQAYVQRANQIEAQLHAKDNQAAFIVS